MSIHGNRLAGITSDGGFVVWELPEIITDDVPYVSGFKPNTQRLTRNCSGKIMLCVLPPTDIDGLHAVKWHPRQPDLVAVALQHRREVLLRVVPVEPRARAEVGALAGRLQVQPGLREEFVGRRGVLQGRGGVVGREQVFDYGAGFPEGDGGVGVFDGGDAAVGVD